jgi:2-aminobenzoate-CoA ligase
VEGLIEERHLPPRELWPDIVIPKEMIFPPKANLAYALLDRHIKAGKNKEIAAYFSDTKVTYEDVYAGSIRIAHALAKLGVKKNSRVAFMLLNSPEALMVNFAILRLGAIPVPASPFWSPENAIFILNNVEAQCLIVTHSLLSKIQEIKPKLQNTRHFILVKAPIQTVRDTGFLSLEKMLDKGDDTYLLEEKQLDDIGIILHTSGTTGTPKGCVHLIKSVLTECYLVNKYVWRLASGDTIGGSAPLTFAAGYGTFCLIPFWAGASVSLVARFIPEEVLKAITQHKITILTGLTTTYQKLLECTNFGAYDLSSLRICTTGGSSLEVRLYKKWLEKTGLPLFEGLGATEFLHLIISNAVRMKPKPGSVGLPLPGIEIKIINEEGKKCHTGEMGRKLVKGPTGAIYWKPLAGGEKLLDAQRKSIIDGYTFLGDIVCRNKDGYIYFIAREEDLIFKEGHKIGPMEIEEVLKEHPLVEDAGVVEMDIQNEEKILAFVSLKPRIKTSHNLEESLNNFCKEKLVSYEVPDEIHFVDFIPRTPAGKPLRWMLREWESKRLRSDKHSENKS